MRSVSWCLRFQDAAGTPTQVCFISPAVTPWYSGLGKGANNPSFRVFHLNDTSLELEDVK